MNWFLKLNLWLQILFINMLVFVLTIMLIKVGYETNDDSFMMLLVNGSFLSEPFDFPVLMHLYYGKYLVFLYANVSAFLNWYILHKIFFHYIAFSTICYVVLSKRNDKKSLLVLAALYTLLVSSLITQIQFSSTGIAIGSAGVLYWVHIINNKLNYKHVILSGIFLFIAGLLRWQAFILVSAMFGLVVAIAFFKNKFSLKYIYPLLIIVAMFFSTKYFEYQEIDRRFGQPNYLYYHNLIEVVNNPMNITNEKLKKIGYSHEDISLIKAWYWMDPIVFSKEKLIQFSLDFQTMRSFPETCKYLFEKTMSERYTITIFLLLLLPAFLLFNTRPNWYLALGLLALLGLFFFLGMTARIHHRITVSFQYFVFVLLCINFITENKKVTDKNSMVINSFSIVLLMMGAYFQTGWIKVINEQNEDIGKVALETAKELKELENMMIVLGDGLPTQGFNQLYGKPDFGKGNITAMGWSAHSPWNQKVLDDFEIENITTAMYTRKDVILLGLPYEQLSVFIKNHYHRNVVFEKYPGEWKYISPYQGALID